MVRFVDCRWYLDGRSGRDAYEAGHLPGAVFADVDVDLAAPPSPEGGRHPMPTPEAFAAAMTRLGIGPTTPVVAYDDAGGAIAARLWWMLHVLGHPVAVLDGGIGAWVAAGGELEVGSPDPSIAPADPPFAVRPWPADRFADADAVDRLRREPDALVLDARTAERYRGDPNPVDPSFGHVPGARSLPFAANLGPDGRLRPPDELAARLGAVGADRAATVVAYCGSGVTACHDLLALEVAGLGDRGVLYPGSWSAWGADPDRPIATGDEPG